eukprot:934112-Rhodomonas_salina.3
MEPGSIVLLFENIPQLQGGERSWGREAERKRKGEERDGKEAAAVDVLCEHSHLSVAMCRGSEPAVGQDRAAHAHAAAIPGVQAV